MNSPALLPSTASLMRCQTASHKSAVRDMPEPPFTRVDGERIEGKDVASVTLPQNFRITHGDRVVDPSTGATKTEIIHFYALVALLMMPHLKDRPVSLLRAPDGISGELFFQKHMATQLDGIALLDPDHAPLIEITEPIGLLSAAQMNAIEFHTWNGVKTAIGKPDRISLDLDPGDRVSWQNMQEAMLLLHSFLEQLGLKSFPKTSGGKDMHVMLPLQAFYDWETIKDFSHAIVEHIAKTWPMHFVAKSGARNRVGKIYIDYLRNGFAATTVSAWSLRARPGLSVSVPVAWQEVEALHSSAQWTVLNIASRLDQGNTPWEEYEKSVQDVTTAMKLLCFAPPYPF